MELDELKTKWHELDGRLDCADVKIDRLTARVAAGKITSAKQRLARMLRMQLFLLAMLPLLFSGILRSDGNAGSDVAVQVLLGLFVMAMLGRQVFLIVRLARIDPVKQSVLEACAAVVRFRSCFLAGVVIGIALGVPFLVAFGIYVGRFTTPYVLYGFWTGLTVGVPLGVRVFLRMRREIDVLREALHDVDGQAL